MSKNRSTEDRVSVASALTKSSDPLDRAVAAEIPESCHGG